MTVRAITPLVRKPCRDTASITYFTSCAHSLPPVRATAAVTAPPLAAAPFFNENAPATLQRPGADQEVSPDGSQE